MRRLPGWPGAPTQPAGDAQSLTGWAGGAAALRQRAPCADSGPGARSCAGRPARRERGEAWHAQVQRDIREGHAQTVDRVLAWLPGDLRGVSVCDAGCGTGSLALPLALRGADVSGFDISQAMGRRAGRRAPPRERAGREPAWRGACSPDVECLSGNRGRAAGVCMRCLSG